jgi:hypothetical protein
VRRGRRRRSARAAAGRPAAALMVAGGADGIIVIAALLGTPARAGTPPPAEYCRASPNTDFIGDNKYEFRAANWSACCAACARISPCHYWTYEGTPTAAGPCFLKAASSTPSGHTRPGRVSGSIAGAHGTDPAWPRPPHPPPPPPWLPAGPFRCASALDCSLNGRCSSTLNTTTNTSCVCGPGWVGRRCESLDLMPARRISGFRARSGGANTSSWGAPCVRNAASSPLSFTPHLSALNCTECIGGGDAMVSCRVLADASERYHMWPAEMTHHCGSEPCSCVPRHPGPLPSALATTNFI